MIPASPQLLDVEISAVRPVAELTKVYEILPIGPPLPAFSPGSHIDLHLPDGLVRQYSLARPFDEGMPYAIGVKRDAAGRGGSAWIHDHLKSGMRLQISAPRNNFPLVESAEASVLIAGGVGITPIWCMVQRLHRRGLPWRLVYAARTKAEAAFASEIESLNGDVVLHYDDERGGFLDIARAVGTLQGDIHAYCCGPAPMLEAFKAACSGHYDDCVHVEYFAAEQAPATGGGYEVELRRSGVTLAIPPGKTILEAMRDAGIEHPYACEQGVCGSCEARVIEGVPDHRDQVLTADEKAANRTMMVCCSGCLGPRLVLDV